MRKSTVQASSGLLPGEVYELSLEPSEEVGWRVRVGYRGDREDRSFEFSGGTDPQAWLALQLASEHGFEEETAARAAVRLFSAFVHVPPSPDQPAEPYGMAAPSES